MAKRDSEIIAKSIFSPRKFRLRSERMLDADWEHTSMTMAMK